MLGYTIFGLNVLVNTSFIIGDMFLIYCYITSYLEYIKNAILLIVR